MLYPDLYVGFQLFDHLLIINPLPIKNSVRLVFDAPPEPIEETTALPISISGSSYIISIDPSTFAKSIEQVFGVPAMIKAITTSVSVSTSIKVGVATGGTLSLQSDLLYDSVSYVHPLYKYNCINTAPVVGIPTAVI